MKIQCILCLICQFIVDKINSFKDVEIVVLSQSLLLPKFKFDFFFEQFEVIL